jgi:hypothetical protein
MIKDFVPAKANLSTGLTIKPHILERNKIERHEPIFNFVDYSGSIETAFISGSNGLDLDLNTDYTEIITNDLLPPFPFNHTDRRELFTGELDGTEATVYYPNSRSIVYEKNKLSVSTSVAISNRFSELPFQPTLNNILNARTTNNYLDVDYAYNPNTPVNINFLSASLALSLRTTAFPFLDAAVQDSNYTLKRHTQPRYEGSRLFGQKYNVYSPNDISYGSDPVINLNSVKFAYFDSITSQSLTFNGRSNANIKYLIDSASNIIELTEANNNVFDVQDIFNKTNINISLDNTKVPSNQKSLNGLKSIYAGGFRYEPILQNYSTDNTNHSSLIFNLENELKIDNPATGSQVTSSVSRLQVNSFSLASPITLSPSLNTAGSTISAILNSGINVNVTRTAASTETVYQRISGQITVNVSVSPGSNEPVQIWKGLNFTGTTLQLFKTGIQPTSPVLGTTYAYIIEGTGGWNDNLQSIRVPAGKKVTMYGGGGNSGSPGGNIRQFTGPTQQTGGACPLCTGGGGYDSMLIEILDVQANFSPTNQLNSFGSNPTFNTGSGGPYNIEEDNGLSITATFLIDGIIALPPDEGLIGSTIPLPLKTLNNTNGVIRTTFNFNKTSTSPNIRFTTTPTANLGSLSTVSNGQYILTDAPNFIYTTQLIDNGYESGSIGQQNWYFERGVNNSGLFTQLTASYNLSNFYKEYISSPIGQVNYFTQVLPTSSINSGYQDITELFIPKIGDLIKFYNHESNRYPYEIDFEREIINIIPPQGPVGSGSFGTGSYENRLIIEVLGDSIPNISCTNKNNLPGIDPVGKILNFILLSKIADETNIIINHEKNPGETSSGILFTEDINSELKKEAGNIIKGLKAQNLI